MFRISVWGTFGECKSKHLTRFPWALWPGVVYAPVSVNEANRSTSNPNLLDEMQVHHRVPWHNFTAIYLYTWQGRGTVTVKCLAQEHNTLINARNPTQTAQKILKCFRAKRGWFGQKCWGESILKGNQGQACRLFSPAFVLSNWS